MDWTKAGWVDELAAGLSDGAVWLLKTLRSVPKSPTGTIHARSLHRFAFIQQTLDRAGTSLDEVLSELVEQGFLTATRKHFRKTAAGHAVEHTFRLAIAFGTVSGLIDHDDAEIPTAVQKARAIIRERARRQP